MFTGIMNNGYIEQNTQSCGVRYNRVWLYFRIVRYYLPDYKVEHPRRQPPSC
jgi:hypothetical protein